MLGYQRHSASHHPATHYHYDADCWFPALPPVFEARDGFGNLLWSATIERPLVNGDTFIFRGPAITVS